ncbi:class I SAM-dependent methyltransferase [Aquibaculum sediminis]|uniref:class I SAM-dependent methyltransferase n=1 Tax=Aquibaculum sediminis TaxID=3231907 RepID=UPI0034542C8B
MRRAWVDSRAAWSALFMTRCSAVVLDGMPLHPAVETEYLRFASVYHASAPNLLNRKDYARWSYVLERLPEGVSVLDVGVGAGQFISAASRSGRFGTVEGLDIARHSRFLAPEPKPVNVTYANAENMPFKDDAFDYVLAMEIIEHLGNNAMLRVLKEIRRVGRYGTIITVPYCEKKPLPKYHKQRFNMKKINELFPSAAVTLCVEERKAHWACIEEGYS